MDARTKPTDAFLQLDDIGIRQMAKGLADAADQYIEYNQKLSTGQRICLFFCSSHNWHGETGRQRAADFKTELAKSGTNKTEILTTLQKQMQTTSRSFKSTLITFLTKSSPAYMHKPTHEEQVIKAAELALEHPSDASNNALITGLLKQIQQAKHDDEQDDLDDLQERSVSLHKKMSERLIKKPKTNIELLEDIQEVEHEMQNAEAALLNERMERLKTSLSASSTYTLSRS